MTLGTDEFLRYHSLRRHVAEGGELTEAQAKEFRELFVKVNTLPQTAPRDPDTPSLSELAARGQLLTSPPVPVETFREACGLIFAIMNGEDGEAWHNAERFLKAHAPDLFERIGK